MMENAKTDGQRANSDELLADYQFDYSKARANRFAIRETRMSIEQLETEVMKLDLAARAALAEKLLRSLDNLTEAENEALWAAEAERRANELRSGTVNAVDGEEAMRRATEAIS